MSNNYIGLSIDQFSINEDTKEAVFVGFDSKNKSGEFKNIGAYAGKPYFALGDIIRIDSIETEGDVYRVVKIQECAFSYCQGVRIIEIGPNVKDIDWNMYRCCQLQAITVDRTNPIYHDIDGVLFKGTELIGFPQARAGHYNVPKGTTKIGNHAFKSCSLTSITFPSTLIEIGINAFYECKGIKEFVLPHSIRIVQINSDIGGEPIRQIFYLSKDRLRQNPLTINDVMILFSE